MRRLKKYLKVLSLCMLLLIAYNAVTEKLYFHESIRCEKGCTKEFRIGGEGTASFSSSADHKYPIKNKNISVVTNPIRPDIVIYNRVPKCGSSSLRFLIKRLGKKNRFHNPVHSWPNVKQSLTPDEERTLVEQVTSFQRPALFIRHLHFVDFEKYGVSTRPVYINMIRNPVDRFISHFYFSRYGFQGWNEDKIKQWLWPMSEEKRNMTLEECVRDGADTCIADNKENFLAFFCGQHKRCRNRDDWALSKAKENIERNFAFIGILERMKDSLRVAEAILPRYFTGILPMFRNYPGGGQHTKTARKKEPSRHAREMLEKSLNLEMQLYEFVKERFVYQFDSLKANGRIT